MDGRGTSDVGGKTSPQVLQFSSFRLDPADARLWRGKRALALKPKTFAVLHYLLTHAGRLVTKRELLDAVWTDVHVGDAVVKTAVKEIRRVLGDSTEAPRFIATVHRHGYRFISPVVEERSAPADRLFASPPSFSSPLRDPSPRLTPLVGRDVELTRLQGMLAEALEGGRRLVLVSGVPGIGKSALLDAFLATLADRGDLWLARGQCLPHFGPGEPYLPMLEALGSLCREPGATFVQAVLARYAPAWLTHLPALLTEAELDALQRRTGGMGPEHMLRQMAEAVEALTAERILVLCFDDLQWCDRATLDLIDTLARRQSKARLLMVGVYRSTELIDADHPLLVLKGDMQLRGRCEEIALQPLAEAAVAAYCASRFGAEEAPSLRALPRLVHKRSGGHPLFMTAIIDDLVRRDAIVQREGHWSAAEPIRELVVPASVREFVAGEFERLEPSRQRLLEGASVIGMEFSVAALEAALADEGGAEELEATATELMRRHRFLRAAAGEEPGGVAAARFAFRHDLYREVVYARLTRGRRSTLHRRIGEWLERAYGERAKEIAGTLALHFEESADWFRASRYHRLASEQAQRRYAPHEAAEYARRGLACIQGAAPSQERIQEELLLLQLLAATLITMNGFAAPELSQVYARADELCNDVEDPDGAVPLLCGSWNLALNQGDGRRASEVTDRLLTLSEKYPKPVPLLQAYTVAGQTRFFLGEPAAAEPHLERSLELYDFEAHRHLIDIYGEDPGVVSRLAAGWVRWMLGRPDLARQQVEDGLSLSHAVGHPFAIGQALWASAIVHQHCGDVSRVQEDAEALIRLCRKARIALWLGGARILRGWALAHLGRAESGAAQLRRGINQWRATGTVWIVPYYLSLLAEALTLDGACREASSVLRDARTMTEQTGERWCDAELYRLIGERARHENDEPTAAAWFQRALEVSRCQGAKGWELRAATDLARLWRDQGRLGEARDLLAPTYGWFSEGFDTADLKNARALLDALA